MSSGTDAGDADMTTSLSRIFDFYVIYKLHADDAEVVPPPLKCKACASGDATIRGRLQCGRRGGRPSPIKVQGMRKRRRHDSGTVAVRTTRRSSLPP